MDNGNLAGLLLTLHSGLLEVAEQDWNAGRVNSGLHATLDVLREQSRNSKIPAKLDAQKKLLEEAANSPAEMVAKLDRLIDENAKLAGTPNEAEAEFEKWRHIFEKSCREREEILIRFPWLHLHEPLRPHLNHEAAHELRNCGRN